MGRRVDNFSPDQRRSATHLMGDSKLSRQVRAADKETGFQKTLPSAAYLHAAGGDFVYASASTAVEVRWTGSSTAVWAGAGWVGLVKKEGPWWAQHPPGAAQNHPCLVFRTKPCFTGEDCSLSAPLLGRSRDGNPQILRVRAKPTVLLP